MGEGGTDREDAPKRSAEWRKLTNDLVNVLKQDVRVAYSPTAKGIVFTGIEYDTRDGRERKWDL